MIHIIMLVVKVMNFFLVPYKLFIMGLLAVLTLPIDLHTYICKKGVEMCNKDIERKIAKMSEGMSEDVQEALDVLIKTVKNRS